MISEGNLYTLSKNLAVLSYAGAMSDIKLTTEKLRNIKEDLAENTQVSLTSGAFIYAGSNDFRITYNIS